MRKSEDHGPWRDMESAIPNLEPMAKAICSAWPKVPDGCAAIFCMQRLGSIPPDGCRYAIEVHGERARKALAK
jgi:hypothetical protein